MEYIGGLPAWVFITIVIVAIVVFIILVMGISNFNKLTKLQNAIDTALSNIDVQLQKRNDLIPNFVETVKGYCEHEKETFVQVMEARDSINNAKTANQTLVADTKLSNGLKSLYAVAENYPDLKADSGFQDLRNQLNECENEIASCRKDYNACILSYNNSRDVFPTIIFANIFKFKEQESFDATPGAEKTPEVKF